MKSFKKEIKKRILWITLFAILGGLAVIIAFVIKLNLNGGIDIDSGLPVEVLIGFFAGMESTAFIVLSDTEKYFIRMKRWKRYI